MSNPFDQFAVDVQAALPGGAPPAPDPGNPFGSVFSDAPAAPLPPAHNKPVMNSFQQPPQQPPMGMPQQQSMGMMGQPPPQQQPPQMGSMGMGGMYGQPSAPQQQPLAVGNPPPPAAAYPFAGYGGAAPPQPSAMPQGPTPASPNPYGAPSGAPFALPPATGGNSSPNPYGAPSAPMPPSAPPTQTPNPYGGAPPAPMQAAGDPFGAAPAPGAPPAYGNPYGAPPAAPQPPAPQFQESFGAPQQQQPPPPAQQFLEYGAPQQQQPPPPAPQLFIEPYGAPQQLQPPPPADPGMGALVVSNQPSNPYAQALPPQHHQQQMYPPQQQAPPPPSGDPFSVFESAPAPPPAAPVPPPANNALVLAPAPPQQSDGDLWGDLGFDPPAAAPGPVMVHEEKKDSDLPPGGEFYDARIFTPTLGVMFFKPQELTDSLFLNTERSIVDALTERPVVAFIVEGSSARSAGVELGHVLLKVNGVDVRNPKEASRLIKEGPRPLPLMFYVPNTDVVVAEGEHMVKYDTKETTAPNSSKDWKPKYVVIGGIIAQPWMMNMYRSKSEYDIAVIETQARRPVSVKVKQFSMQGARIQNDWQGPQMVKYKNKLHPWKYIVCLPVARNPIKISSPNLAQLKPVHEGIRRVLLAQQRSGGRSGGGRNRNGNGNGSSNRGPPKGQDPYNQPPPPQQQMQTYNQPPPQQMQQQQQQQQYPPTSPPRQQQYSQPPPQQQYNQPPPQQVQQQQYPPQNNGYGQQPGQGAYGY